jgi:hypothetical protein
MNRSKVMWEELDGTMAKPKLTAGSFKTLSSWGRRPQEILRQMADEKKKPATWEYKRWAEMDRSKVIGEELDGTGVKPEPTAGPFKTLSSWGRRPPKMLRQKADEKKPANWEYERRAEMEKEMVVGEECERTGVKIDLIPGPEKIPPPSPLGVQRRKKC